MDQVFFQNLEEAGFDRIKLRELLHRLDSEKSRAKLRLQQVSTDPEAGMTGKKRDRFIRFLLHVIRRLTDERETVSRRLGRIGVYEKALNRAVHTRNSAFPAAFVAAAEMTLTREQFEELERMAGEVLTFTRQTAEDRDSVGNK